MCLSTRIKAPKGFEFKVIVPTDLDDNVLVELRLKKGGKRVGAVELEKSYRGKFYSTHSNLNIEFRNQKLGALMYAKAIAWCLQNGFKPRSSGYSSDAAERVWQSKTLRKYFKIRCYKNTSMYRTWFAYSK